MSIEERRAEPRTAMVREAHVRWAGGESDITVVDASSVGMQATTSRPPARGEFVELVVGPHALVCQVRWSAGNRFGLAFREPVSVTALLDGEPGPVTLAELDARGGWLAALTRKASALGRGLQFTVLAAVLGATAAGAAAWSISSHSENGRGPVDVVRLTMAGSTPAQH
ncbi:PilZ domain-containing protein [Novosphingobium mangrovi (ex Huang et al. 2023)]|uniref:PilZ domain-containing protein n=1 Tax=Novosphingobium mangrovi (ex Huang et al. 2023) TaxID=2976432 RepID=A0ABT2I6R8_9SPHN|nr:PilZ domain-containing protein [Novosphingobium mangrovi (ex Huang et al. 2023)]MCT2400493.1 PilZ domain-containing protein [Novosphingobium mangrovi (ex Huang et al. 2023)]